MDHANLVPALTASPLLGPNAMRGTERGLAGLLEAGFEAAVAVPAYLALVDFVLGTVFFDTSSAGRVSGLSHSGSDLIAVLPADAFATLRAASGRFVAAVGRRRLRASGSPPSSTASSTASSPTSRHTRSTDRLGCGAGHRRSTARGNRTMTATGSAIGDPLFWRRPLEERMADFAVLREQGPFTRYEFLNLLTTARSTSSSPSPATPSVVEISRNAADFCSGQGAISIADMPAEAAEFFGSFINMDDPRHARQRGIVARSFTPRQLQGVLDSVETICTEVIDDMCEKGEVDLVEAISQPFPLLVICDMMGIPRSEFATVLRRDQRDPRRRRPRVPRRQGDLVAALFGAGITLTTLMNELADGAPDEPDRRPHLGAGQHRRRRGHARPPRRSRSFFILLAVAGNDTTRTATSLGMHLLGQNPDQRQIWQDDLDGVTATAVDEIVRMASPVTFMRRTVTRPLTLSGHDFDPRATSSSSSTAPPTATRGCSTTPSASTSAATRTPTSASAAPAPTSASAPTWPAASSPVIFRQLFTRLPDIEVTGPPDFLDALGAPLVGGVKRLPVRFTPTARVGAS